MKTITTLPYISAIYSCWGTQTRVTTRSSRILYPKNDTIYRNRCCSRSFGLHVLLYSLIWRIGPLISKDLYILSLQKSSPATKTCAFQMSIFLLITLKWLWLFWFICLNKSEVKLITSLWIIWGPENQANLLKNDKYTYCAKISNQSSRYTQKQYTRYIVDAMFYNKQANVKRVPLMLSGINMSMSCGEFKNRFCRRSLKSNITPYLCTASIFIFISFIDDSWFVSILI